MVITLLPVHPGDYCGIARPATNRVEGAHPPLRGITDNRLGRRPRAQERRAINIEESQRLSALSLSDRRTNRLESDAPKGVRGETWGPNGPGIACSSFTVSATGVVPT
jgi:hypothetical protein